MKAAAAARALELVRPGMVVGLGTGSTAALFLRGLGAMVRDGLDVCGVPTSREAERLARECGIPLLEDLAGRIDLDVDGADEIDPELNLVKGGGGAHLREKLVAESADRFVVIADETKLVGSLGATVPVPVEVVPFLWRRTAARLEEMGLAWSLRGGEGAAFETDNGNLVLELAVPGGIPDPAALGARLKAVTGVVEHGIFAHLAVACLVGEAAGVRVLGQLD
ncbi:MAG: ribose-5-phosphate isomerase RpiA [Candidatus Dormibacterales bacterium]